MVTKGLVDLLGVIVPWPLHVFIIEKVGLRLLFLIAIVIKNLKEILHMGL